jgi:hypothetical protein
MDWSRLLNEPTVFAGVIRQGILAAVLLGLPLSNEAVVAIMLFVEGALTYANRALVVSVKTARRRFKAGEDPTKPMDEEKPKRKRKKTNG